MIAARLSAPGAPLRRRVLLRAVGWTGSLALALAACGGSGGGTHEEREASGTGDATLGGATAGTVVAEAGGVRLVRGARSEPRLDAARVRILEPAVDAVVEGPDVTVRLAVEAFEPGAMTPGAESRGIAVSDRGQHVHLILDEGPYEAIYDVSGPVAFQGVAPGTHVLFAFPSRAWHESVKAKGALAVTRFRVAEPGAAPTADPAGGGAGLDVDGPLLVYSRPKGTYAGSDADSVMVDFYLANASLSPDGYTARLTVGDLLSARLTAWVPYYLVGLPAGEHVIGLELLDADGDPVGGPLTRAQRTITVQR